MPEDISFLPDELRKKEQELQKKQPTTSAPVSDGMKFSVPRAEEDDVDIIEIDEGDVDQVLSQEPFLARTYYRATTAIKDFWHRVSDIQADEPPPKLPPQFFTPPVKKIIPPPVAPVPSSLPVSKVPTQAPTPVSHALETKTVVEPEAPVIHAPSLIAPEQIHTAKPVLQPFDHVPRRVRVIRRVRKPLRVSFVSSEDLRSMRIDVSRRKFTFVMTLLICSVVLSGGTWYANVLAQEAHNELQKAITQITELDQSIKNKESQWSQFATLEPRLIVLKKLLDGHVSPTRMFDLIEQSTLPTVSYQSMILTPDHKVMLATTADSFESASAQVELFSKVPFVSSADAGSYAVKYATPESSVVSSIDFQLQLTLTDQAWHASVVSSTSL